MFSITNPATGEVVEFKDETEFNNARAQALAEWHEKSQQLAALKESEMAARKLSTLFLHDPEKTGGTENVDIGNGYKAKLKVPLNYGFVKNANNRTDKERIEKALSRIEHFGEVGELIAERLIDWQPKLSLTEYKQLDAKYRKIIDEVIVTSEGTPTLEIVAPKQ